MNQSAATESATGSADATRTEAYLTATNAELEGTRYTAERIALLQTVEGREVYAVTGADSRCILIAGVDQPAGKSEQLTCQPAGTEQPLATTLGSPLGTGVVWTGAQPAGVTARDDAGRALKTATAGLLTTVSRSGDGAGAKVTWNSSGGAREVRLMSNSDVDRLTQYAAPRTAKG